MHTLLIRALRTMTIALSAISLFSCSSSGNTACIDASKVSEGPCTMEYRPVCGCDGNTYGNPCQAERAGLTSWKEGECE